MEQTFTLGNGISASNGTELCHNLRTPHDTTHLSPTGNCAKIAEGGWRPLGILHPDENSGEWIIVARSNRLKAITADSTETDETVLPAPPTFIVAMPGGFICGIEGAVEMVEVMVDARRETMTAHSLSRQVSPLTLVAEETPMMSTAIMPIPLSGSYSPRHTTINDTDLRSLTHALTEAYISADAQCRREGRYLQPVVGYYRLLDGDNRELYRSMPYVLGSAVGLNCLEQMETSIGIDIDGNLTTGLMELSATPFRIGLAMTADTDNREIFNRCSTIEVCLSPQIHPVDFAAMAPHRIESHQSNGTRLLCHLPGTATGMNPQPSAMGEIAIKLSGCSDSDFHVTHTIGGASVGNLAAGETLWLQRADYGPDTKEERTQIERISTRTTKPSPVTGSRSMTTHMMQRCSAPHSFTATTAISSGSTLIWGNIRSRLFQGYSANEMGRTFIEGPGEVTTVVELDRGDGTVARLVNRISGVPVLPTMLNPLLSYPDAAARRMSIYVKYPDNTYGRLSTALTAVPGTNRAISINPTLAPIIIPIVAGIPNPGTTERDTEYFDGALLSTDIGDPLTPVAASQALSSHILNICDAPRSDSGWNFAHSRLYLTSAEGIFRLSVDSRHQPGKAVRICEASTVSIPCSSNDTVYVVADGNLLSLKGTHCSTLARGLKDAGWCGANGELWATTPDGRLRIYNPSGTGYYTRQPATVERMWSMGRHLFYTTADNALYDASTETLCDGVAIALRRRFKLRRQYITDAVEIEMQGAEITGDITLRGDNGAGSACSLPIASIAITSGAVNAPIMVRFHPSTPAMRWLTIDLRLTVSSDFTLDTLTIFPRP